MDWFAEAKGTNDVHRHTAIGEVQVRTLGSRTLFREGCTECFCLFDYQCFGSVNRSLRERTVEYIFAIFRFGVREEPKAGSIFVETLVKTRFFIPAILVVVYVVVGLWVGKVELHIYSQCMCRMRRGKTRFLLRWAPHVQHHLGCAMKISCGR
jgi:hypothetical protein